MYTAYFSLSEAPFTIAPDPAYLFLSNRHKEALNHLSHGLGDHGGFVLLTGEVGTGKTTVSRTVMERLPENTQAAFILNPTLSCEELLATICDNLKIRYKKTGATLKYLTDKIQAKLLKNHEDGINTLLIVDEAQHLQPEVLEQLRLLTNLETNTKKLLQVILIGQPELQVLLQRRDLRQLAQRITARYHLLPLNKQELKQYIEHRLNVAKCTRDLFNSSAINQLHKISGGVPRLVNLLCDRSLIIAYNTNQSTVNGKIVKQAAVEALGSEPVQQSNRSFSFNFSSPVAVALTTVCAVALGVILAKSFLSPEQTLASQAIEAKSADKEDKLVANSSQLQQTSHTEANQETQPSPEQIQAEQVSALVSKVEQLLAQNQANTSQSSSENNKTNTEVAEPKAQPEEEQQLILGYRPDQVDENSFDSTDLVQAGNVSNELFERFQQAIEETDSSSDFKDNELPTNQYDVNNDSNATTPSAEQDTHLVPVHQLPAAMQDSLPSLNFDQHVFATNGEGWVKVNGIELREGDEVARGVVLKSILPQLVVLKYQGRMFTMPALSSW